MIKVTQRHLWQFCHKCPDGDSKSLPPRGRWHGGAVTEGACVILDSVELYRYALSLTRYRGSSLSEGAFRYTLPDGFVIKVIERSLSLLSISKVRHSFYELNHRLHHSSKNKLLFGKMMCAIIQSESGFNSYYEVNL